MDSVIFRSPRLVCRRWSDADLAPIVAAYSDADAMRWVGEGRPLSPAQCQDWLAVTRANYARYGYGMFTLVESATRQVVGFAGLVHPGGQPDPEIKYALLRAHWGRGLATEAVRGLLAYGTSVHALARITATVAPGNAASLRVLAKVGMVEEARGTDADGVEEVVLRWPAG